jgi:hypothetical protein
MILLKPKRILLQSSIGLACRRSASSLSLFSLQRKFRCRFAQGTTAKASRSGPFHRHASLAVPVN